MSFHTPTFSTCGIVLPPTKNEQEIHKAFVSAGLEINQFDTPSFYQIGIHRCLDEQGKIEKYLIYPVNCIEYVQYDNQINGVFSTCNMICLSNPVHSILRDIANRLNTTVQIINFQEPKHVDLTIYS